MNKSQKLALTEKVINTLAPLYAKEGFRLEKKKNNFIKGDFKVLWGVSSTHIDSVIFRPQLRVENGIIKKILKEVFPHSVGHITTARSQSTKLLDEIGVDDFSSNFITKHDDGSISYYYDIENDANLEPIVEDHFCFMNKAGFQLFNNMSTMEGINDYINSRVLTGTRENFLSEDRQSELKIFFDKREVLSGVISAYMIKNPKIDQLLERYRILFEGNDYILEDIAKVEEYFKNTREV